jgi:hypothetical protein
MGMKENQQNTQLENKRASRLRRHAVDQMAFGFIILLWGSLLSLK